MFVANSYIEIGQELLFDYNDRQSRLPFLRSCPICNEQSAATSKRQQLPDATESQPAAKRLNVDSSESSASSANSVVPSLATASTSATAGAESTPSTAASTAPAGKRFSAKAMTRSARAAAADNTDTAVPSPATASTSATAAAESTPSTAASTATAPAAAADTADSSPSDLLLIARKSKLTKAERQRLYKAAGKRFPAKAMTRSAVESWLPGINSRSVDYVMQRRNADACNAFKLKLRRVDDDDDDVEDE